MLKYIDRFLFKQPRLRRFVTRLVERNKNVRIAVAGSSVTINTRKEHGYLMASRLQRFSALLRDEVPVLLTLGYFLRSADTFIDIGANVGIYTSAVSRFARIRPLRQYAFEANPDTFSRLKETNREIGAALFNCAVSDHEGELEFVLGAVSHVFTTHENFSQWSIRGETIKVKCQRLDSFQIEGVAIVMKIDVEGQEYEVLCGAAKLFSDGRVLACYVDGYSDERVPKFLVDHGFKLYEGRTLTPVPDGKCFALLAVKDEAI